MAIPLINCPMTAPLFSILIPSYNRPELLVATIESVLGQAERDFELIVSDDASPRGPEISAVVRRFESDNRFKFVPQPRNLGWSDNRNALLKLAKAEFVLLLGDDDLLLPHALSILADYLRQHEGCDLAAFGYKVIDMEGKHCYERHFSKILPIRVGHGEIWEEIFLYDVLPMWAFHSFTLCCRRTKAVEWGYDKRCGIGDDVFFLFRAIDGGCQIDVLPDVLFAWRRAFKSANGYINLSSSSLANDKARRSIWILSQQTAWQDPRVRELIHSDLFAHHFLGLPWKVAREVAQLGTTQSQSSLAAAIALIEKLPADRRWQVGKIGKMIRMRRIGGVKYLLRSLWKNLSMLSIVSRNLETRIR